MPRSPGWERVVERLDGLEQTVDKLARYTVDGFQKTVAQVNSLQAAFERFVELSLEERRRVWSEIDRLKERVSAQEGERWEG